MPLVLGTPASETVTRISYGKNERGGGYLLEHRSASSTAELRRTWLLFLPQALTETKWETGKRKKENTSEAPWHVSGWWEMEESWTLPQDKIKNFKWKVAAQSALGFCQHVGWMEVFAEPECIRLCIHIPRNFSTMEIPEAEIWCQESSEVFAHIIPELSVPWRAQKQACGLFSICFLRRKAWSVTSNSQTILTSRKRHSLSPVKLG